MVPVSAAAALAWAAGRLSDTDLLLRTALVPEAVFLVNLPDLAGYRTILKRILHWRARGACFMVTRTGNPIVDDHILKNHGQVTFREQDGPEIKYRFIVPPAGFDGWVAKFGPHLAAQLASQGADCRKLALDPALAL